ncbi:MAG: 2-oxoacid:acceptor oxidoreductase subunit alpha [Rhodospirillaceae bacterium]
MTEFSSAADTVSVAITGSGGAGAITAGSLLLEAAGRAGWYGLMTRTVGPQIRGGEAAALVRLSRRPVPGHGDRFDLLIALDWRNVERFVAEIPLGPQSVVLADDDAGDVPEKIAAGGALNLTAPFAGLAEDIRGARPNIIALGTAAALVGLPLQAMIETVAETLAGKGVTLEETAQAIRAGFDIGTQLAAAHAAAAALKLTDEGPAGTASAKPNRWMITGNQAAGLGALRGGIRFAALYPITPATDLLEWMAPRFPDVGGVLCQAEDEIAAVQMAIGASYGGVPSLTTTSGPGLALKLESIGLAVAAEVPLVVFNVMRGGPSTGIPTKSEQTDLNIALYGLHGEAPHIVVAPLSVEDCVLTTQWAVHLAETLQTVSVVLSDQFLGQAKAVVPTPPTVDFETVRLKPVDPKAGVYKRYALTNSGISPMAIPGQPGGQYTADGLEHNERGTPSSQANDHHSQLDKRNDKLANFDYGDIWAEIEGEKDAEIGVITWGSSTAPVREALARARQAGIKTKLVAMRLISPARPEQLAAALKGVKRLLVVEQSHSGQFLGYLKAQYDLPTAPTSLRHPGPLAIRPAEVCEVLSAWS